ncbi:MAG: hypothetical protein IJ857_09730 [Lachnospiraceae bacterium]|nr:hypothetical protein [Lachnospiraceae bacterium]
MSNSQLYPFERNRYYPGKLLTSADFQAEQNYHINKGRFINGLMYGSGVVCGLGVFSLDDLSVLIESGVAIDGTGREIILDTSVVKKISAIEGFDRLETDTAVLKIRYNEQDVHSVYSVNHKENEKEYEFNRIAEGYELFLVDKEGETVDYNPETEFLTREILFKSENYVGEVMMPATVCKGRNVKIVLEIRKVSDEDVRLSCRGILEIPVFHTPDDESELEIGVEDLNLKMGESIRKEYWVRVLDNDAEESELILRSGSAAAFENENAINSSSHFAIRVRLSKSSPLELVSRETGRINLEMRNLELSDDAISLAEIQLVRNAGSYIIDNIRDTSAKKYVLAPAQEIMRNNYMSYYVKDVELKKSKDRKETPVFKNDSPSRGGEFTNIATGTLEVPLGRNAREGDIRYSGEIAHGLGPGNVYVEIGYNFVSDDPDMGANQKSTIYGNPELFSQQNNVLASVETGIKVLNEKGSFVVAARLLRNVDFLVLSFRWVAIRFPSGDDIELTEDYYDKSISVDTPTVIMGGKESHFFGVRFNNMKACSITYELTSPGSGEISSDGIYTAPSKEGVYEIRIYCTDMPVICTYAYAIVKKKMIDDKKDVEVTENTGDSK